MKSPEPQSWDNSVLFHVVSHPPGCEPGLLFGEGRSPKERCWKSAVPCENWTWNLNIVFSAIFCWSKQITRLA